MPLNQVDAPTTRRFALTLLAATGALLFKAIDLVGAANIAGQTAYAEQIAESLSPLSYGFGYGLIALVFVELAAHPSTPATGHPHSVSNYLQSAFALIVVAGLVLLVFGAIVLIHGVRTLPSAG